MTNRSEHDGGDTTTTEPEHIEHTLESIGKNDRHNWIQRGVEMQCDGNNDHFPHAFNVDPELVFMCQVDVGLQFKNVKTGEQIVQKFV